MKTTKQWLAEVKSDPATLDGSGNVGTRGLSMLNNIFIGKST
jgi:hypothetical protein